MINSCLKGKRIERAFRDVLRLAGYLKARRGKQYSGNEDAPDVQCEELPEIFWEVKGEQNSRPHKWLGKALTDSGGDKMPVVAWKRNYCDWVAFLYMDDLLEIIRRSDLPFCNQVPKLVGPIPKEVGPGAILDCVGIPHNGKGKISIPVKQ